LDAQNAGNGIPVLQIFAWYVGHTRDLQPLLSPSNILSHRKVPFQKMPPHGKILKKGPGSSEKIKAEVYVNQDKYLSDLQTFIKHSFLLYFPRELLMIF
jgi:hypothetical protein